MKRASFCVVPEKDRLNPCIEPDQRLRTGRHPGLVGLRKTLGGGQASAGSDAKSNTSKKEPTAAARPEPAVTLPAAG
ncbi:hypothetical protein [Burkholderia sp. BCC1047]|uniref:hypothetical protein n=1 Tax=Burkholderia sp. BCC1047 TaxID=2676299 RepID=UPI00158E69C2|nr:hypothetical protein [Burkholderia sp. BCC1047]